MYSFGLVKTEDFSLPQNGSGSINDDEATLLSLAFKLVPTLSNREPISNILSD